ncbi:Glycosyl hydrolase, family 18 [Dirofilaria immitis]|nr:Glycosyl hydrolase, family 18 [Dirofilaria immitis]
MGNFETLLTKDLREKPPVQYIEENLCTHYNLIGSCTIDEHYHIVLPNITAVTMMREWLKGQESSPKLLITLTPANNRMSYIVKNDELRKKMVEDVTEYLLINQINGFDIDWEFPVWGPNGQSTDRKGLSILIKELRESFDHTKSNLLLTVAVAAPSTIVDIAYDVDPFNKYLDFVQIMNYDFHMYSKLEPFAAFNAPLFRKSFEIGIIGKMNSDHSTKHWLKRGLWANKTIFGIPTYGRGYTLLNKYFYFIYAPAIGNAAIGASYPFIKVCNLTKTKNYKYIYDMRTRSAYIYGNNDRQWLGFENPITMFSKASYIKAFNLAGIMIFDLASDDYEGICKLGTYPLTKAAKIGIRNEIKNDKSHRTNEIKYRINGKEKKGMMEKV